MKGEIAKTNPILAELDCDDSSVSSRPWSNRERHNCPAKLPVEPNCTLPSPSFHTIVILDNGPRQGWSDRRTEPAPSGLVGYFDERPANGCSD